MDQKGRLNKKEFIEIKRLLENYIDEDKNVQIHDTTYKLQEELTKNMQETYEKCMNIDENIKKWLEDHGCNDTNYIQYSDCEYDERKYNTILDNRFVYNYTQVYIKTYGYSLKWYFINAYKKELTECFNSTIEKYYDDINNRIDLYKKIMQDMVIVLNSLKTANAILEKFGFIDSINKYINNLLMEQAKPISCMTQAVENSVDNYLSQRKALDEENK